MRGNDVLRTVLSELREAGAVYRVSQNRHLKVRWKKAGTAERTLVVSCSASDVRAVRNAVAFVRRQLRATQQSESFQS